MKILVIHPEDYTTDFLSVIYADLDCTVITDPYTPSSKIKKAIKEHDKIICLGHGTEFGLIAMTGHSNYRNIVDSKLVYLLKDKDLVLIWCNANQFASKYDLKGFITGMIISEDEEANIYNVNSTQEEICYSNELFAEAIAKNINHEPSVLMENSLKIYKGDSEVIEFNIQNFNVF